MIYLRVNLNSSLFLLIVGIIFRSTLVGCGFQQPPPNLSNPCKCLLEKADYTRIRCRNIKDQALSLKRILNEIKNHKKDIDFVHEISITLQSNQYNLKILLESKLYATEHYTHGLLSDTTRNFHSYTRTLLLTQILILLI